MELVEQRAKPVRRSHLNVGTNKTVTFTRPKRTFDPTLFIYQARWHGGDHEANESSQSSPPLLCRSNPEGKSPYAWTNLINTHHILTHPALSFSSLIRWLLYVRRTDNVQWPWTRHRTLQGLCFPTHSPFSSSFGSARFMRAECQAINHRVISYASITQDAHHALWLEARQTVEDWFGEYFTISC